MLALINGLYPNRVQLQLSNGGGQAIGPLASAAGVPFDPRKVLEVYIDGDIATIETFSYDSKNDQYLIFTTVTIDVTSLVQVVYHMPAAPFLGSAGVIQGFALIAGLADVLDPVPPVLAFSVPLSATPAFVFFPFDSNAVGWGQGGWDQGPWGGSNSAVFIISSTAGWGIGQWDSGGWGVGLTNQIEIDWFATGVALIRFQGDNGFDTGQISAAGILGKVFLPGIAPGTTVNVTLSGYDIHGNPLIVGNEPMTITFAIQVPAPTS